MKKCVVIGSGLGGLSCGCILSKNGYEVTVLEQGSQIGGCLQCFQRNGVVFDTGMHYIGSGDKGQTLHTMLKYLGIDDKIKLSRLNPEGYDIISFKGKHYKIANGKENFVKSLAEHFPDSKEELCKYYDLIKLVVSSSAMHALNSHVNININAEYQTRSIDEVMDEVISDPLLKEILVAIQFLYAGEKKHTPFATHALISDFYDRSAFRIVGGSSIVAESLAEQIKNRGGKVLTHHKVEKIVCDDKQAIGVETSDGEFFPADLVISAIHPTSSVHLLDTHLIRPIYRQRLENVHNTTGAFTVYLKFRKDRVPYMNHNLYYYRNDSTWGCQKYKQEEWPKSLLYMHFCHKENPEFAETGEILTYMNFEEMKKWEGTHVGHRGEDYENFKKQKAEAVIQALEEEIPGIRENIEEYYTSTPLTYLDYTGIPEGAIYGVAKDIDILGPNNISCKTRVPNLLLTGQSITCHGMMGVLAGSFITSSQILSMEGIISQLNSAN